MLNIYLGAKFTSTVCFTYKDNQNLMDLIIYTFIIFSFYLQKVFYLTLDL